MFIARASTAQFSKGQFLTGGSGTYSASAYTIEEVKLRNFEIDGRGGIFLLNKLAAGISLSYYYNKEFGINSAGQYFRQYDRGLSAGPFVRYYFLPSTGKINFLADASYFRSWSKSGTLDGGTINRKPTAMPLLQDRPSL